MIAQPLYRADGAALLPDNRWDLLPERATHDLPDITVVVPYFCERHELELLLEGLKLQRYPISRFEVVVADDGSPRPLRQSDLDVGDLTVRIVRQEDRGFRAAAARNLAVRAAEGTVLCFLDQDTVPAPEYLQAISSLPAAVPDALVVGRREHVQFNGWSPGDLRAWVSGDRSAPSTYPAPSWLTDAYRDTGNLLHSDESSYQYVISAVMSCSRDFYREIGGFDESFTEYGGEDWELAYRAWNGGAVLAHQPAALAWHDGPDWARRGTSGEREAAKAREEQALRMRIPRHRTQEDGSGPANVLLSLPAVSSSVLGDLLQSSLNLAVYLPATDPDPRLGAHPRVRAGRFSAQDGSQARYRITVDEPVVSFSEFLPRLESVLTTLRRSEVGQVLVPGWCLRADTSRATARATRWARWFPERPLLSDLFTTVTLSETEAAGVSAVPLAPITRLARPGDAVRSDACSPRRDQAERLRGTERL